MLIDVITQAVREAGAKVTDYQGRPHSLESKTIVSANPILHSQVLELVNIGRD
ncbi:hypothetical protein HZA96_03235 [Candidatus Woesearchaeota archaeon]|nr:hypothetical protein [Candidatus Woesearchaeota archaeon]